MHKVIAAVLFALVLFGTPAEAVTTKKVIHTVLKYGSYVPCVVCGFATGHLIGPFIGAYTGDVMWGTYWSLSDANFKMEEAAKAKAKADKEAAVAAAAVAK